MNKSELTEALANKAELTMKDAREIVSCLFDTDPKTGITNRPWPSVVVSNVVAPPVTKRTA